MSSDRRAEGARCVEPAVDLRCIVKGSSDANSFTTSPSTSPTPAATPIAPPPNRTAADTRPPPRPAVSALIPRAVEPPLAGEIDRPPRTASIGEYLRVARFLRPRFAVAQLGARRQGVQVLEMLPVADELPGSGWRVIDERCWRTGISAAEPWALRARAARSVTGWRSFEQRSQKRWVWTQVVPLASDADGVEALKAIPTRMLANLRAEVTVTSRREIAGPDLPATHATWAEDVQTSSNAGRGQALHLVWVAESTLSMIACSSLEPTWSWDQVTDIATAQLRRIQSAADSAPDANLPPPQATG